MIEEKIFNFISDIENGKIQIEKVLPSWEDDYLIAHYGNIKFRANNGWEFVVFFDCGEWDYFDCFIFENGSRYDFDNFSDELKYYRPKKEIEKRIYTSPGYLGDYLKQSNQPPSQS